MGKSSWFGVIAVAVLGFLCQYFALIWSPPEKTMGNLVRIMYFHVGSAWIAFLAFFVTALFAVIYLIRRNLLFDRIAVASAEIGVVFTSFTLITGSLWAKPIWNTWWTWDPRLTTTLILWFLYVGYLLLRGTIEGLERRARISGIFGIVAFADVPVIHFAVEWWRSIHPQVIDETGFNMPGTMIFTLMFAFAVFFVIYLLLLVLRTRQETQKQRMFLIRQGLQELRAKAFDDSVRGES
ncbi:cytochrome c biogenesis protein CcsA [Alicyclobacillus ferrooxydans]|uniref:cytochrome c biogenesis protein CcsA n=1 Tax=Alicyclobacillus ferrooxydans TaxID=471514 RepID=UPI0006D5A7B7|nr:cytochrome c biogenesis protein CcsA [Alicyclobacillus ferrooxydans]